VFAVFLIVAASGALNVASVASVFGREVYKPLARLSGLLAVTLLAGGLAVLVRPERRETAADLWIRPPRELLTFLKRWRDACGEGR